MLGTILIIILILLLVGALPTWGYSSGWGYYPGGTRAMHVVPGGMLQDKTFARSRVAVSIATRKLKYGYRISIHDRSPSPCRLLTFDPNMAAGGRSFDAIWAS